MRRQKEVREAEFHHVVCDHAPGYINHRLNNKLNMQECSSAPHINTLWSSCTNVKTKGMWVTISSLTGQTYFNLLLKQYFFLLKTNKCNK